jgi:hypothetical protein
MMVKRKIVYDDSDDNKNVSAAVVKKRSIKQVSTDMGTYLPCCLLTSNQEGPTPTSTQCSICFGKGTRGRLAQMQEFEWIQTSERVPRPSKMDLATQGEDMNPMAPSFQGVDQDSSRNSGGRSRAAVSTTPETRELLPASPPPSLYNPCSPEQPLASNSASDYLTLFPRPKHCLASASLQPVQRLHPELPHPLFRSSLAGFQQVPPQCRHHARHQSVHLQRGIHIHRLFNSRPFHPSLRAPALHFYSLLCLHPLAPIIRFPNHFLIASPCYRPTLIFPDFSLFFLTF